MIRTNEDYSCNCPSVTRRRIEKSAIAIHIYEEFNLFKVLYLVIPRVIKIMRNLEVLSKTVLRQIRIFLISSLGLPLTDFISTARS